MHTYRLYYSKGTSTARRREVIFLNSGAFGFSCETRWEQDRSNNHTENVNFTSKWTMRGSGYEIQNIYRKQLQNQNVLLRKMVPSVVMPYAQKQPIFTFNWQRPLDAVCIMTFGCSEHDGGFKERLNTKLKSSFSLPCLAVGFKCVAPLVHHILSAGCTDIPWSTRLHHCSMSRCLTTGGQQ